MGLLSRLFGQTKPQVKNYMNVRESAIVGIAVVVASPTVEMKEADAVEIYAQKNPTWSRRHPVKLLRTSQQSTDTAKGLEDTLKTVVASDYLQALGKMRMIIWQDGQLSVMDPATGKTGHKVAFGLFTIGREADKVQIAQIGDREIRFQHDLSEVRVK